MNKKLTVLVVALMTFSISFSQPWMKNIPNEKLENNDYNFYDIQKAFNEYWDGKEIEKGKGWKQFKRYENFVEPRVYPTGEFRSDLFWKELQKEKKKNQNKNTKSATWEFLGPFDVPYTPAFGRNRGVGRINTIAFHPTDENIFWIGAPAGGIWKTVNGGDSWETHTDELAAIGISDIAVNPDNPDVLYAVTGDGDDVGQDFYSIGIIKSTDGGLTWEVVFDFEYQDNEVCRRILINPNNPDILIASTSAGIYYTDDAWVTNSKVQSGHFKDMEFKSNDPNIVFAASFNSGGGSSKIFKSVDGGFTWELSSTGISNGCGRIEMGVTPADPNIIYALCCSSSNRGFKDLYVSIDDGVTWTEGTQTTKNLLGWQASGNDTGGQGTYDLAIAVSPTNSDEVYVGGINIWKSSDGGSTWSVNTHWSASGAQYMHGDQHWLVYNPTGNLFAGNDGGIYKTENNGSSWDDISSNLGILQIYRIGSSASDSTKVTTGAQDNGTMLQDGTEWTAILSGDGMECIIDYTNPNIIYGESQFGNVSRSSNGGNSFFSIKPDGTSDGAWITPYVMHPEDPTTLLIGYKKVYKTTNSGSSWDPISSNFSSGNLTSLTYAPSNTSYIYAARIGSLYKTSDGGHNWSTISGELPNLSITYIAVSNFDPNVVWVTFSGFTNNYKVFLTLDGGSSWINYSDGLPNLPANCIVHDKNSYDGIYVGTDLGVYYRNFGMDSWEPYGEGLPNVIVNELEIHYETSKIRAGTFGRSLWEASLVRDTAIAPVPGFTTQIRNIITGESIDFRDISVGDPTSWLWTFESGTPATSEEKNPIINYYRSGSHNVTLEVTNEYGTSTIIKEEYINVLPSITAYFDADVTEGDVPLTVNFTDNSEGEILTWFWDFGDGTSSTEQNPTKTFNVPGEFTVNLTVTGPYDTVDINKYKLVEVLSTLSPEFSATPVSGKIPLSVNFSDNSSEDVSTWNWNFGDESVSTEQNPEHTYQEAGSYTIALKVSNGEYEDSITKEGFINIWPVNVNDINENSFVSIYPNPTNGIVNLLLSNISSSLNLDIIGVDGKRIKSITYNDLNFQIQEIDLSNYPKGLYLFKLSSKDRSEIFKIMIE